MVVVLIVRLFRRALLPSVLRRRADVREQLRHCSHRLCPTLAKHHAQAGLEILRVLDEAEANYRLITCS